MLSNQVMQSSVEGLKSVMRKDITIMDREGKLAAATDETLGDIPSEYVKSVISSPADHMLIQGKQYFKILDNKSTEYVLIVHDDTEDAFLHGKLATFHFQTLMLAYKDRLDRENFIKNLLLDNLLLVDIYARAKKLNIESVAHRIVYLVETNMESDTSALEILKGIFPDKEKDFVTAVDESSILLVKEINPGSSSAAIESIARMIVDTLTPEIMSKVRVAIGGIATDLKNVSSSFKEARLAREVGLIFEPAKQIVNYDKLGIGRLIYQLPPPLCKIFIHEMFQGFSINDIDDEMYATVTKFFENDLNVSETSRELFIHRNTLVYRLDKLEKLTKLDLRKFSDAITFKIALMVNRYMQFREGQ